LAGVFEVFPHSNTFLSLVESENLPVLHILGELMLVGQAAVSVMSELSDFLLYQE